MPTKDSKKAVSDLTETPIYRCPTSEITLVCPHYLIPVGSYAFITREDVRIETFTCAQHGDVVPRRSAVANIIAPYGPRTGTHPLAVYTPDRNAENQRFAAKLAQSITSRMMESHA